VAPLQNHALALGEEILGQNPQLMFETHSEFAPGRDSMLVMRNCLRGGRRVKWCTAAATLTRLLQWAVTAAIGVSSLPGFIPAGVPVRGLVG
jgi:threonine/homoserine/homoserine lactone efflux protein